MTARCSAWGRTSTGCAPRSGSSTGCCASAIGFDVEIREVTEEVAALAVQGPTSCAVLKAVGLAGVERLKPFELGEFCMLRGGGAAMTMMVSRTGFTGDLGYELWMHPARCRGGVGCADGGRAHPRHPPDRLAGRSTWRASRRGSSCRTSISSRPRRRCTSARERSPLELGLAWLVDFKKGHFTGRRALLAEQQRGPRRQLVGLDVDGNKPAHECTALYGALGQDRGRQRDARRCGRRPASATSRWRWSRRRIIATGSTVWAEIYLNRELVWERRMVRAQVVERPFFAPARRRATPPADF